MNMSAFACVCALDACLRKLKPKPVRGDVYVRVYLHIYPRPRHPTNQKRSENEGEEYVLVELVAGVIVIFFAIMVCVTCCVHAVL